jgi:hypothetical protein
MNLHSSNRLLCPLCGAAVTRVRAVESQPRSVMARIGDALISEILFWPSALVIAGAFLWSFLAGVALIALGIAACAVWYKWEPWRAAYRCEACQSVLTYQEVIAPHERAV